MPWLGTRRRAMGRNPPLLNPRRRRLVCRRSRRIAQPPCSAAWEIPAR
ncbi:MAG: hypothetical protein ACK46L_01150 [Synechococcaceae cyanobacterium]